MRSRARIILLTILLSTTLFVTYCIKDKSPFSISTSEVCNSISWSQTFGPHAGSINAIGFNTLEQIIVGAATFTGAGLFRFNSDNRVWTYISDGTNINYVSAIDLTSRGKIFIGDFDNGVFMSIDNGDTWFEKNVGLSSTKIAALTINKQDEIFIGVRDSIFRSIDDGNNWQNLNLELPNTFVNTIAVNDENHIFVGTSSAGIFRSTDEGEHWSQINSGLMSLSISDIVIGENGYIYVALTIGGINRSIDNGDTWIQMANFPNRIINCLAIDPVTGHIYAGGEMGVFRSTDNGLSWSDYNNGLAPSNVRRINISNNGEICAGTRWGGLYRNAERTSIWSQIGLPVSQIDCLTTNEFDYIFAGSEDGIFRSTNYGASWNRAGLKSDHITSLLKYINGYIFAAAYGLYISTDSGESWEKIDSYFPYYTIEDMSYNQNGDIFVATFQGGVLRSTDGGYNWMQKNNGLPNQSINSLVIDSTGWIFAGTSIFGVFRSTDIGEHWNSVNSGLSNKFVRCLAINKNNYLFAGTNEGVFYSEDKGTTWKQTTLTNFTIFSLEINAHGDIFAATTNNGTIFYSSNNGQSWIPVNDGLPNKVIRSFTFTSDGKVFAGTTGSGVFRSDCSTIVE